MLSPRLTATYPHAVHYNHPKYTLYQNTPRLIQPTPGLNIRRILKWKLSGDYSLLLARLISFSGAGVVAQYGLWLLPQSQCRRTGAMGGSRLKRMYSLWQFGNIKKFCSIYFFTFSLLVNQYHQVSATRCQLQHLPTSPTPLPLLKSRLSPNHLFYHNMKQPTIQPLSSPIPSSRN